MTAPQPTTIGGPLFAPIEATLAPSMLLPGWNRRSLPFPFDATTVRYHYLGRNAAHAVVRGLLPAGGEMLFPAARQRKIALAAHARARRSLHFPPPLPRERGRPPDFPPSPRGEGPA